MAKNPPVVYVFHGEDEFAIAQSVAELKARLGDPALAEMNFTRLDARAVSFDELATAAYALPFLAPRRLVVLDHPLTRFSPMPAREKFLKLLESLPPTTALALVENRPLTGEADRKKGQVNWLEKWALQAGERVYLRAFRAPSGSAMAEWIQRRARILGGQFAAEAAAVLAGLAGEDVRLADQEIRKLLEYAGFERPVEAEDVELLTPYGGEGNFFALVDALGHRNGQQAMGMLRRLAAEQDHPLIFWRIVQQFRLLLLAREVLESGGDEERVVAKLKLHPYYGKKIVAQAREFTLPALDGIYRRLLEIDAAGKSGEMEVEVSLDTLVASLTMASGR